MGELGQDGCTDSVANFYSMSMGKVEKVKKSFD